MAKAGLGDEVIIQQIKNKAQPFDLSTDQLIQLKSAGVSDRVIQVMLDPSKPDAAPAAAVAPKQQASAQPTAPSLPIEVGVYAKRQETWVEVLPEVVNWKTGGVLKHIGSAGIVKGDVNGHIEGLNSRNSFPSPIEFLIVTQEGVAITEYQLLRLRPTVDSREFRTVTGGAMHTSGGATRDVVPFEGKKLAPRTFSAIFPANLGAGEYGFLPPGAVTSSNTASAGKIYSFRVIE